MSSVLEHLFVLPGWLVLVVTGALVFAEDALFVGFVIPAETVAVLAGVAAAGGHLSLTAVIVTVVLTAIVGDSVGYEVGRRFGGRLLGWRRLDSRREQLENAQLLLARRGGLAVLLSRLVAFLRAVMPTLAGSARMPYRTFLLYNAVGGVLWGVGVVLLGYFAGASYEQVEGVVGKGAAGIVLVVAVLALVAWRLRERRERRASVPPT